MHLYSMKNWVLNVVITVFIISLISMILPNGKTAKHIKATLSLIVLLVIITPIFNITKIDYDLDNLFNANDIVLQDSFLDYVNKEKVNLLVEDCLDIISEIGVDGAEITINYTVVDSNTVKIHNATIYLENAVINSETEHIVIIDNIKQAVSEYLKIEEVKVVIYE